MSHLNSKLSQLFKQLKQQIKLHWLDLVVVGLIIAAGGFLLWQRSKITSEWITVQIKVAPDEWWWPSVGPESWYSQELKTGDWGFNSFGEKVIQIQNVQAIDIGSGRDQIIVWAKIKVGYNSKRDQYIFGFQPIQIGKSLELDFSRQRVKGLVVALEKKDFDYIEKTVKLRVAALDPIVAASFFIGQDSKTLAGEPMATITDLKILPSIESQFSDIRQRIVLVSNPQFVTLELTVKLKLRRVGEQFQYIDGQPVKLGQSLPIQFPQVTLPDARVIEFLD